jgi:serine/threonine protein kinase
MNSTPLCPTCGKPLAPNAPQGLCPECLMKAAFATGTQANPGAPRRGFIPPSPTDLAAYFPQLEIISLIGQGGMGAVYRARQPALDRLVALKVLPPETSQHPAFTDRFTREARALAKLNHPNIVTVYDFGRAGEFHYLVMEFVDGTNLRQLLNTTKMTAREALAIVPPICAALQFAHDRGIVHRDIKPENILIDKAGTVKIADFGLAKLIGPGAPEVAITTAGDVMGTPHYMAPEQVERPLEVDHRADIYSLGVVFYQMLTGELPLGRFGAPSTRVQIDVRLDEIVLRALEKQPELRYQQASALKTEVETVAHTEPAAPRKKGGPIVEFLRAMGVPDMAPPPSRPTTAEHNARRKGKYLIVSAIDAKLPLRCVKTNVPVSPSEVRRQRFEWIPPIVFFSLLLTPIAFILFYYIFRRKICINVPISAAAQAALRRAKTLAIIGAAGGLLAFAVSFGRYPTLMTIAAVFTLSLLVYGVLKSQTLRLIEVKDDNARFVGAVREFLASLPPIAA